jgi:hypothetical protein
LGRYLFCCDGDSKNERFSADDQCGETQQPISMKIATRRTKSQP